ncbi:MAG: acylneuraminate cytidylyltransferase family protein [Bacteroidota bacterium]
MNLFLIPARGGSKGLPGKNIKPLNGKPLIIHSLDYAHEVKAENDIIHLSTDDEMIRNTAIEFGYQVPELRPAELATDQSPTEDTIRYTLQYYASQGITFKNIIVLQPTSPFREALHFNEMMLLRENTDMVVSVGISKQNPYFSLFEENKDQFLEVSKKGPYTRRQDCPPVYFYNGTIYIINVQAFNNKKHIASFDKIRKYVMADKYCIDIDTEFDFKFAELITQTASE